MFSGYGNKVLQGSGGDDVGDGCSSIYHYQPTTSENYINCEDEFDENHQNRGNSSKRVRLMASQVLHSVASTGGLIDQYRSCGNSQNHLQLPLQQQDQ